MNKKLLLLVTPVFLVYSMATAQQSKPVVKPRATAPVKEVKHVVKPALVITPAIALVAAKSPLKPADINNIPTLADPQLSPDGKWIAYSLAEVDTAKDSRVSHLWMQSYDGKQSIELTNGPEAASSPKWSPDNKFLSFVSERESKNGGQIWIMDRRGGEGKKLTDIKADIQDYAWSPDSKKLVLVLKDQENNGKEPKTTPPIKIDRYHFKQDVEGYLQHLHQHLYLYDIATKKIDTLTDGDQDDEAPVWSPDGKTIAYVSNHTFDPDKNENTDIFTVEAKADGEIKQLTTFTGHDLAPLWSPDGKHIAYLRSTSDANYYIYQHDVLCLMDADGKNNRVLTAQLDRPVSNHAWSRDSKDIVYLVSNDRIRYVAQYNVLLRKSAVINKGTESSFESLIGHSPGNWIAKMTTPYMPHELVAIENGRIRRLTFHQDKWLSTVKLAKVKGFQSFSSDGTLVSGILYTPDDSTANKKLPFILYIHGGPTDQDEFEFDVIRQTLACAGYAVAAVNYRGSTGRGLEYTKAIYADWGNKEVTDLLGAVDELVKTGVADKDHLGIGGWSYGGILTDYTIATDTRFKAASSGAGSALQLSIYGSDQWVVQYDNELGQPWKNADKYIKLSYPFFHADKIKTPTQFMSGLKDFNVPTSGGEQMYQALKSEGVPTQMVLYPGQYHGITVPSYQVDRLQRYIEWYNKFLKPVDPLK
ncbi:Dipeptidyl aminopeptidase/acylaminoacyl peptidase [Mucilaginibacter pineti]|uniref:Acyl-peptide hydrolase n=1 Tax=Mucilaginibacter pineti TaxID=1391627 RepID=A0A1G7I0R1_9SPHI|nr:S9 family peptidase [Mucilaginibacter pineti]SDF06163.1 Dipeptidyl aminopeptidase/acylaminoacyl peptidase [Mucilaginibacter pineti]